MKMTMSKNKKITIIAVVLGVAVLLAVGLGLIFGLKSSEFAWSLVNLSKLDLNSTATVELDDANKTVTIENLKQGDEFSFDVKLSNGTGDDFNYRLSLATQENTMVSSQLQVDVNHAAQSKAVYGSSVMELEASTITAGMDDVIKVTITAGADVQTLGECVLKVNLDSISEKEGSLRTGYTVVTTVDGLKDALTESNKIFLTGKPTETIQTTYDIVGDLVIPEGKSLRLYGEAEQTPVINMIDGAIIVEQGATVELQNVILNGYVQTVEAPESQVATLNSQSAEVAELVLNNVIVNGKNETFTYDSTTAVMPAIFVEKDSKIQVIGNVEVYGAAGATAIGVAKDASVTITGDSLVAIGSKGREVLPSYYTSDEEEVAKLSCDPDFLAHLANGDSDEEMFDEGVSGSGIGAVTRQSKVGNITIDGVKALTAEGYGHHAYGIGGEADLLTIKNSTIVKARGGWALNKNIASDYQGKSAPEGAPAIGLAHTTTDHAPVVKIENCTIKAVYGGSKAAGIGCGYWSFVTVEINNSIIEEVYGGSSAAAIGSSRITNNGVSATVEEYLNPFDNSTVVINDTVILGGMGGEGAAGIGGGTNTNIRSSNYYNGMYIAPIITIKITGASSITITGGKWGAGIGGGYHTPNIVGYIENTVDVSGVVAGANATKAGTLPTAESNDKYSEYYTTPEKIGLGKVDPTRTGALGVLVDGTLVAPTVANGGLIEGTVEYGGSEHTVNYPSQLYKNVSGIRVGVVLDSEGNIVE